MTPAVERLSLRERIRARARSSPALAAVLGALVAFAVTGILELVILVFDVDTPGQLLPGIWFLVGVVIAVQLGGRWAALLAAAVSTGMIFVVNPSTTQSLITIGAFLVASIAVSWSVDLLDDARAEAKRESAARAAAEARLRTLEEANVVGVFSGVEDRIVEANDAFLAMVGRTRDELDAGTLEWTGMTPPGWEEADATASQALRSVRRAEPFEKEYLDADGHRVPVLLAIAAYDVEPLRWIAVAADISDRKERELQLERDRRLAELVAEIGQALTSELHRAELVQLVLDAATPLVEADFGLLYLRSPERDDPDDRDPGSGDGPVYTLSGSTALDPEVRDRMAALDTPPYLAAMRPGHALRLTELDPDLAALLPPGTSSVLVVPIARRTDERTGGRIDGTLLFGRSGADPFTERHARLSAGVAAQTAVALENARLFTIAEREIVARQAESNQRLHAYRERDHVARLLQESLLPAELPRPDGIAFGARYLAAGEGMLVGGDFYDVFEAHGCWHVVIGDVCGKGPDAAAVTGMVRSMVRTVAMGETDAPDVLKGVNEGLMRLDTDRYCTLAYATLAPEGGRIKGAVTLAGHPRPLVRSASGVTAIGEPGRPVGLFRGGRYEPVEVDLGPGDSLIFYTDGVTDHRDPAAFGEDDLASFLASAGGDDPAVVANAVVEHLLGALDERDDDIAVLVVQPHDVSHAAVSGNSAVVPTRGAPAGRSMFVHRAEVRPGAPPSVTEIRHQFSTWLLGQPSIGDDLVDELSVMLSELVTNAVRAAEGGHVAIEAVHTGDAVRIEVVNSTPQFSVESEDIGPRLPDPDSPSGRGLFVVEALADDLRIDAGTEEVKVTCVRHTDGAAIGR